MRRATDGAPYALKVLDAVGADAAAGRTALAAFGREAALLACVDHPGLVRIHEVATIVSTG